MFYSPSPFRSLAILFCAIVLSGLPLPILDAHPTSLTEVSNQPSLLLHLQKAPACEHHGVEDSEVHIHWVSILLSNGGLSDGSRFEQTHDLLGLPQKIHDERDSFVVILQWDFPRVSTVLFDLGSPPSIRLPRASGNRNSRLLI